MNDKSCLLDATAHTLCVQWFANPDIPDAVYNFNFRKYRETLVELIGHDGSERGFHTQEIQDAIRRIGVLMQRHELYPCLQLPPGPDFPGVRVVPIYDRLECPGIFLPKLNRNNGVLMVKSSKGVHHALSFTAGSNTAYDVAKNQFLALEDLNIVMYLEFIHETDSTVEAADSDDESNEPTL